MPSTVEQLFAAAGRSPAGVVGWGERVPLGDPGIYVVSLDRRIDALEAHLASAPISYQKVERWLADRPELTLDGVWPSAIQLVTRLCSFWLPDEVVLYAGLAGTSLAARVGQYYTTPLGARSPHAGGHWLKTLENLDQLFVHFSPTSDPALAERALLERFCARVSEDSKQALFDPERSLPFANLNWPGRGAKRHGIKGSKEQRTGAPISALRKGRTQAGGTRNSEPPPGLAPAARPTLHAELYRILCEGGNRWMSTEELAEAVNLADSYRKKDGTPMTAFQVHGRTRNYPRLFERKGPRVRARDCP